MGDYIMGLFDVDGIGFKNKEKTKNENSFDMGVDVSKVDNSLAVVTKSKDSSDFDKTLVGEINPLVKVDVINHYFKLSDLLREYGCYIDGSTMYCPFHDDDITGKPSAKYHSDTDLLYCFSENKVYSSYHALKILFGKDVNLIFKKIWSTLSKEERLSYIGKHDEKVKDVVVEDTGWEYYNKNVLSTFKVGKVSYEQYKNALYKVLSLIQE